MSQRAQERVGQFLGRPLSILVFGPGELHFNNFLATLDRCSVGRHRERFFFLLHRKDGPEEIEPPVPDDGNKVIALNVDINFFPRRPIRGVDLLPVVINVRGRKRAPDDVQRVDRDLLPVI